MGQPERPAISASIPASIHPCKHPSIGGGSRLRRLSPGRGQRQIAVSRQFRSTARSAQRPEASRDVAVNGIPIAGIRFTKPERCNRGGPLIPALAQSSQRPSKATTFSRASCARQLVIRLLPSACPNPEGCLDISLCSPMVPPFNSGISLNPGISPCQLRGASRQLPGREQRDPDGILRQPHPVSPPLPFRWCHPPAGPATIEQSHPPQP